MFHKCKNSDEVKGLFRQLAMLLHPDKGGSHELMILLNESYEKAYSRFQDVEKEYTNIKDLKYSPAFNDVSIGDDAYRIFEEICEYANSHKKFNMGFIDSIMDFAEDKGFVTAAQYNKVLKIYCAFKMYEKKDKKP